MTEDSNDFDSILVEVGEFGRYQRRICFLILFCVIVSYSSSVIFVFETKPVNHRCEIFECDVKPIEYKPDWWTNAIPAKNSEPSKCSKYQRINNTNNGSCAASSFNHESVEQCKIFVYETNETSIMHDVIQFTMRRKCLKLTLVGTIHSCGTLIGLPIFGILSDKYGRKTILLYGLVLSGVIGLTRSFASSYLLYIILECLDAFCRSASYPTIWILGSELVSPKKRVLVTLLFSATYAFAGVLEGLLGWILQSWRILLRIIYTLHLTMIFYYWLIPESVRWLLAKKRFDKAKDILKHVANVNGKVVSEEFLQKLENYETDKENIKINSVSELFASGTLMLRLVNSAFCWVFCLFLYNGLTVNSVQLSGNSYLDFILTMAVEIPGSIAYIIVDVVGRRLPLAGGFLLTGLACLGSIFIPLDLHWLKLSLYLLGKFGVSVSICVLYSVTTEVFPTPFRNALLSTCIMFGGLGLMAAPQMPLLESFWQPLPLLLFGLSGLLAAILALLFPETINITLPNTIEEAENIGKKSKT